MRAAVHCSDMTTRRILTLVSCSAVLVGALALFDRPPTVRAQQTTQLQIASISVGADQPLTYPNAPPAPYMFVFPDEHMTFFPPATSSSPYLLFGSAGAIAGQNPGETVVLESTDLQTF